MQCSERNFNYAPPDGDTICATVRMRHSFNDDVRSLSFFHCRRRVVTLALAIRLVAHTSKLDEFSLSLSLEFSPSSPIIHNASPPPSLPDS